MSVDVESLRIDRVALSHRRSPWLSLALIVVAIAAVVIVWSWPRDTTGVAKRPMPSEPGRAVRTIVVSAPGGDGGVVGGGWVEAAPPAPVYVSTRVAGTIVELPLLPGDTVTPDQVIARLDPTSFQLALDAANAHATVAQRRLELLRAGTRVEDIAAAEADLRAADADVERTTAALKRAEELAPDGSVSRAKLEQAKASALRSVSGQQRAAAVVARLRAGARPEEIAEAEARVAVATAAVRRAVQDLAWCQIRAPRAGVVLERFVHPGERVLPSRPSHGGPAGALYALYDPAHLQVRVDLTQADAAQVAVGHVATISLAAAPGRRFPGSVVRIDPLADLAKNTVRVRVALGESDPALRPELTARVEFGGGAGGAAVIRVPARCVIAEGDAAWVWESSGGLARKVSVTLGASSGPEVVVREGLRGGETLVLDPPTDLVDGARLSESERASR